MSSQLNIGGTTIDNRLLLGTGKFGCHKEMREAIEISGTQIVTVALRRVDLEGSAHNILNDIPSNVTLMPNTSGARDASEAIRIARLARAAGLGNWIKIEVIPDHKYLLPDNQETLRATELLAAEGFIVLPYMNPDLIIAKQLQEAGAAAVMPLGAPIGSNRGIRMREMIRILIDELDVPVIVDAGIGRPSDAAEAMEMGAAAVLVNTAIATAQEPVRMAQAFNWAVKAGRTAYEAGLGPQTAAANASSPLVGFLN